MKTKLMKLISIALIAAFLLMAMPILCMAADASSAWDGTSTAANFKSGDGSFGNPYVISTPQEFNYFAMFINRNGISNNKYFILENDLDFGGHTISAVGGKDHKFSGVFDGRGHTISNFKITNDVAGEYVGLFGRVDGKAEVKNFTLSNATISSNQSVYIGAVAGWVYSGTVSNIVIEDSVTVSVKDVTSGASIGGVAGRCYGKIQYVVSSAKLVWNAGEGVTSFVGGITGVVGNGTGIVSDCIAKGEITATHGWTGGIAGITGAGSGGGLIENCINLAKITAADNAGGILGKINNDKSNAITNCINMSANIVAPTAEQGTIIGNIAKIATVKGCSSVEVNGVAKYGSGYNTAVDITQFEMNDISADDAQTALTALQTKIDENATKEAEIVYEDDADDIPADIGSSEETDKPNENTENAVGDTENNNDNATPLTEKTEEEKGGCGSSISFATCGLVGLTAAITGLKVFKKREE